MPRPRDPRAGQKARRYTVTVAGRDLVFTADPKTAAGRRRIATVLREFAELLEAKPIRVHEWRREDWTRAKRAAAKRAKKSRGG